MWMGALASMAVMPSSRSFSAAGGTARSECGATPLRTPCARSASTMRSRPSTSLRKRFWSSRGGLAPKLLV